MGGLSKEVEFVGYKMNNLSTCNKGLKFSTKKGSLIKDKAIEDDTHPKETRPRVYSSTNSTEIKLSEFD